MRANSFRNTETTNHYGSGPKVYALILAAGYGSGPWLNDNGASLPNSLNLQTDYFCGISNGYYVGCSAGQTVIAFRYWYDISSYFVGTHSSSFLSANSTSINYPYNQFNTSLTVQY